MIEMQNDQILRQNKITNENENKKNLQNQVKEMNRAIDVEYERYQILSR